MSYKFDEVIYDSEAVDALTITSKSIAGRAMLAGILRRVQEEKQDGELGKEFKAMGYRGWQVGSIRYGKRLDGSAIFSTGEDAMYLTAMLVDDYDVTEVKTTRIDVCLDVAMQENAKGCLRKIRDSAHFKEANDRAKREYTLIESSTGETLYIGSRQSGRFGRIYDKSASYGLTEGWVYRFEIETKKQVAPQMFRAVFPEQEDGTFKWDGYQNRVRGIVKAQFVKWGVLVSFTADTMDLVRAESRISTVDSNLEWLSRSVKPVVSKLRGAGYEQLVLTSLGFTVSEFVE